MAGPEGEIAPAHQFGAPNRPWDGLASPCKRFVRTHVKLAPPTEAIRSDNPSGLADRDGSPPRRLVLTDL